MNKIGVMGGRLSCQTANRVQSFPKKSWEQEFQKAASCGFDLIEWVFDAHDNPILDNNQIKTIKHLSEKHNVKINSVCADFFMEKKLVGTSSHHVEKNLGILTELIYKCSQLEIEILEIPLVDSSSLKTQLHKKQFIGNIQKILSLAEKNNVIINLETDFPPNQFKDFISLFNSGNVRANYDVGNSAALGYDMKEELYVLANLITNIHIKDRLLHGGTIPLGMGNVNFALFFKTIKKIGYDGDFIIQGARENEKIVRPVETCKRYLQFVKYYVDKYLS